MGNDIFYGISGSGLEQLLVSAPPTVMDAELGDEISANPHFPLENYPETQSYFNSVPEPDNVPSLPSFSHPQQKNTFASSTLLPVQR